MASLSFCPACNTALSLFTPREIFRHVNACLDAQNQPSQSHHPVPRCPVCERDLTELTPAARAEHQNRCVDNLNPRQRSKRPQQQPTLAPTRADSAPKPLLQDKRICRFLELLGLQRYAQRFANEEIDFPALRLLEDSDFAQLRIPDAARRRIADALTAVPIIAQIEGEQTSGRVVDAALVPTQRFGASRLASNMQRNKPMVHFDDSDGEYAPTPTIEQAPDETKPIGDTPCNTGTSDEQNDTTTKEERSEGSSQSVPDYFQEIEQLVKPGHDAAASQSSDISSFASNLGDIGELLRSTSQITIELKLQKWRRRQVERERNRHERELQRIEAEYMKLVKSTQTNEERSEGNAIASPQVLRDQEQDCETIDLTQGTPGEEHHPQPHNAKFQSATEANKGIVISSNESVPKAADDKRRGYQHIQQKQTSTSPDCLRESERGTPIKPGSILRSESPSREKYIPLPNAKEKCHQEEVIDLINTEKKGKTKETSDVSLSHVGHKIAPLFTPTPDQEGSNKMQDAPNDSDEDFMELLGVGKENERSLAQPKAQCVHSNEDIYKRPSFACDSSSTEEAATQSRLKKRQKKVRRPKATSEDISRLIRRDKALYEDVLLMESVPFDRILSSVRGEGKVVTKRALYDFLQNEGVMFKGDSVEAGSQQEFYMRRLNTDRYQE